MARKKAARKQVVTCPRCGFAPAPSAGALNFCPDCGTDLRAGEGEATTGTFVARVIADRYRLRALIGEGGMGAVYKAEHIRMGKALALKILRGDFARQPGAVERFLAEARIVSRLSHPHTIAVFDFGEIDGRGSGFYLAMEYVHGKDLAAVLSESGRLPERRVAEIGQQILGSLAEAHDAGIVHRDIKPGNVMLMQTRSGEDFVKVLDFGIAKLRGASPDGAPDAGAPPVSTTSAGAILGTPSYLAPEQARAAPIDGRSDLYAVGCLLYELAAGKPPFTAPSPLAVVAAHLHEEPPPLARQAPVSRGLAEIVHRALRKRPAERFASADEMRAALHALSAASRPSRRAGAARPDVTGDLRIASRDDFVELDRHVRALRGSRVIAPAMALLLLAGLGAGVWHRRADVVTLLAAHAPGVAARIPPSLRPTLPFDGEEREPNDDPASATPLPLPPGPEGRAAGGVAVIRGRLGARLSATAGDLDVFRIEVPAAEGQQVLLASWHGERPGEGIGALDVVLALNRELGASGGRTSAPLVASVNRNGAGGPETLAAAVEAGTYYLSVREQHDGATGPAEKPTDRYVLEIRIEDARPGEELEPNDGPDPAGAPHARYPEWRAAAARNRLGEGARLRGESGAGDLDVYAIEALAPAEEPVVVVAVPEPGLALAARLWRPDGEDLVPSRAEARARFEDAGDAPPGQVVAVSLGEAPRPGVPALLQLRSVEGEGRYDLLALGPGAASREAVLALSRSLADAGRTAAALELAAAYAARVPDAGGRSEVLLLAGDIAERAAPALPAEVVGTYDRAALFLGEAIFEVDGGKVAYRGAFEANAADEGRASGDAPPAAPPLDAPAPEGAATSSP